MTLEVMFGNDAKKFKFAATGYHSEMMNDKAKNRYKKVMDNLAEKHHVWYDTVAGKTKNFLFNYERGWYEVDTNRIMRMNHLTHILIYDSYR